MPSFVPSFRFDSVWELNPAQNGGQCGRGASDISRYILTNHPGTYQKRLPHVVHIRCHVCNLRHKPVDEYYAGAVAHRGYSQAMQVFCNPHSLS